MSDALIGYIAETKIFLLDEKVNSTYIGEMNMMVRQNMRAILIRMPDELLRRLDDWRRAQEDLPGRAEAIRRLVEEKLPPLREKKAKPK